MIHALQRSSGKAQSRRDALNPCFVEDLPDSVDVVDQVWIVDLVMQ